MPTLNARAPCARTREQLPRNASRQVSLCNRTGPQWHVSCATHANMDTERNRFRASAGVRASMSADGLVLLDVQSGLVLASNPVGARIWQLIDQRQTTLEIASTLADDFDVPLDRARHDVEAFLRALIARGLVMAVLDETW